MELVGACVLGEGIERHVLGDVIEEELVGTPDARPEVAARGSLGPDVRREGRDGFGDRDVQREAVRRLG
jgi:hypothetical protein